MPFYFKHAEHKIDLEDLPLDRWITVQEETGHMWHEVLSQTVLGDAKVAKSVAVQCCAQLGIEYPNPTLKTLVGGMLSFEAEANVPEQFNDGIPDPKVPATDPATT